MIHHGALLYDGDLTGLVSRFAPHKTVVIDLEAGAPDPTRVVAATVEAAKGHVVEQSAERVTLRVPRTEAAAVTSRLLDELPIVDLVVEEPPVDEVIDLVFSAGPASNNGMKPS